MGSVLLPFLIDHTPSQRMERLESISRLLVSGALRIHIYTLSQYLSLPTLFIHM